MRLRSVFTSFLTGVLLVGAAWAGVGLTPLTGTSTDAGGAVTEAAGLKKVEKQDLRVASGADLGADELLVGAAKVSLEPNPGPNDVWERDREKCLPVSEEHQDA